MAKETTTTEKVLSERPPVVVIMGHVDHGKSTLLDFIRKSNIVAGEAGGITQHIGAYEASHKSEGGQEKHITFIDTPGHAAFTEMRKRGANVADVAVLVVAADDGVKKQTLEALEAITRAQIPYIVAINKIDKTNANVDGTKQSLAENNIYVEGWGGQIPVVEISAKDGTNVDELLDIILLTAELEELKGEQDAPASGTVVESHRDPKIGVYATLVITNGKLTQGDCVIVDGQSASIRTLEDFNGNKVTEAVMSSPVRVTGFSEVLTVGANFESCKNKKEAEKKASEQKAKIAKETKIDKALENKSIVIPITLKADTVGTLEAALSELKKIENEKVGFKVIQTGVGDITENDIKALGRCESKPIIIGFNVKIDRAAKDLSENLEYDIQLFDVIYHATEYLEKAVIEREDKEETERILGKGTIIATFSDTNKQQVIGGEVLEGILEKGAKIKIIRRDEEVGTGKILGLQQQKAEVQSVSSGQKFGMGVQSKISIAKGDTLVAFIEKK